MKKKSLAEEPQGQETSKKRYRSAAREISYIALTVALITVCAWISVPIAQIPITLQTFAVALAGGLLGWKRGTIAVAVYILMGLIGIPVFAKFQAGVGALFGATGGYIIGFVFETFLGGMFKLIPVKNGWGRTAILFGGMILGVAVLYVFGTLWFMFVYNCTFGYALTLCVVPYILPDTIKVALAAFLCVRLEKFIK